jgi:hypothetical protein
MNGLLGPMAVEAVVAYFRALYQYSCGGTEEYGLMEDSHFGVHI